MKPGVTKQEIYPNTGNFFASNKTEKKGRNQTEQQNGKERLKSDLTGGPKVLKVSSRAPKGMQKGTKGNPKMSQTDQTINQNNDKFDTASTYKNKVAKKVRKRRLAHLFPGPFWDTLSIKMLLKFDAKPYLAKVWKTDAQKLGNGSQKSSQNQPKT